MKLLLSIFFLISFCTLPAQDLNEITINPQLKALLDIDREAKLTYRQAFKFFYKKDVYQKIKALVNEEELNALCQQEDETLRLIGENIKLDFAVAAFKLQSPTLTQLAQEHPIQHLRNGNPTCHFSGKETLSLQYMPLDFLIKLLDHPSPTIQSCAAFNLISRKNFEPLISFIPKTCKQNNEIIYSYGCLLEQGFVGDVVVRFMNSYMEGYKEKKSQYKNVVDSILIFEDNSFRSSLDVFKKLEPKAKYRDRLLYLVKEKRFLPAAIPLLKMKNEEDIPMALELLSDYFFDTKHNRYGSMRVLNDNSVYSVLNYIKTQNQSHYIFVHLEKIHQKLLNTENKEARKISNIRNLYKTFISFRKEELSEIFEGLENKELLRERLFKEVIISRYHPDLEEFIFKLWEQHKGYNFLDSLYKSDPERTMRLALMEADSILQAPFDIDKDDVVIPWPTLKIIRKDIDESDEMYIKILQSDNRALVSKTTFILPVTNKVLPFMVERIKTENDFQLLSRFYYRIFSARLNLEPIKEILRHKTNMLDGKRKLSDEVYQMNLRALFDKHKRGK